MGQVNFALGQMKMEGWWSDGQVKLASEVLLPVVDRARALRNYWASDVLVSWGN